MKVRTDFVTNSSSSSFILAFTSKDTIADELYRGFPEEYMQYFGRVIDDVLKAEPITKDECIADIKNALWEEFDSRIDDDVAEYEAELDDKDYIVRIGYCDHSYPDCDLEHDVMWEVKSVVRGVSEH